MIALAERLWGVRLSDLQLSACRQVEVGVTIRSELGSPLSGRVILAIGQQGAGIGLPITCAVGALSLVLVASPLSLGLGFRACCDDQVIVLPTDLAAHQPSVEPALAVPVGT